MLTKYKAHWDSKKEYDEFWGKGNKDYHDKKKKRQGKKGLIILLAILAIFGLSFGWISFRQGNRYFSTTYNEENLSDSIVDADPESIPDYSGTAVINLNDGEPCYSDYDLSHINGENFSDLDELGRCGTAVAMLNRDMMPADERGSIGNVRPTGWHQAKYPGIVDSEPPYLYNRCHLIAYAMTGQNANELNLITGTRYMNATTMLPYEEQILRYLDNYDNHVLYRVSPYFKGSELLARGLELEAYSVEDAGKGVCFHAFIYNVQPGIEIDYQTGENWLSE